MSVIFVVVVVVFFCVYSVVVEVQIMGNNEDDQITETNKTLGRAQDPRANGAWLRGLSQIIFPTVSVIMTLSLDPPSPPLSVTVNIQ